MIDLDALMKRQVPDDISLGEMRGYLMNSDLVGTLASHTARPIRIRFLTKNEVELPDHMTVGEFRELANQGVGRLVIDDMGGGVFAAVG